MRGTTRHSAHLWSSLLVAGALAAGCGAKSGLTVPEYDAGPPDAPPRPDAPLPDVPIPPDVPFVPPDVCVELPPREPPEFVEVSFISRVSTADVYFLVDVTGSMGEEITGIQEALRGVLVPGIAAEIDDVRFSVAQFADFPREPYGSSGTDEVLRLLVGSTSDVTAVQDAVNRLTLQSGNDGPECSVEALYLSASGEGLPGFVPPRSCPVATSVGYPCFRREGTPIVLLFTDAPSHNGPFGANPYDPVVLGGLRPHSYDDAVRELRGIGAKVLGLFSGGGDREALEFLQTLARDTGAVRPDGSPVVFDIGTDGRRLEGSVIEAIRTLVDEVPIDIEIRTEDEPGDAFDALEFVTGVETIAARPPSGAVQLADRFLDVTPGTEVSFRVYLANERIERTEEVQRYRLRVVLIGDGAARLRDTVVEVVIPSRDGEGCPPTP